MIPPSKTFCTAPWTHLFVNWDTEVYSCCIVPQKPEFALGKLVNNSVIDIYKNNKSAELREKMLNGDRLSQCAVCDHFSDDMSYRHYFNRNYINHVNLNDANAVNLKSIDIRMQNTCNFGCIYCGPQASSFIASEMSFAIPIQKKSIRSELFNSISFNHVDSVQLGGGEPLLMTDTIIILQKIIEESPLAKIDVITNLSNLNNAQFNLLQQMPNVNWIVSLEATHKQYEYIRFNGKWPTLIENLQKIQNIKNHTIEFSMVYTALNTLSIFESFCELEKLNFINNFNLNPVINNALDARNLPERYLSSVIQRLETFDHIKSKKSLLEAITTLTKLFATPFDKQPQSVIKYLKEIDTRRGLNSEEIFPEVYEIINNTEKK
jgi:radical SAM protein with 4Fe4S-binding SPASM domain